MKPIVTNKDGEAFGSYPGCCPQAHGCQYNSTAKNSQQVEQKNYSKINKDLKY